MDATAAGLDEALVEVPEAALEELELDSAAEDDGADDEHATNAKQATANAHANATNFLVIITPN